MRKIKNILGIAFIGLGIMVNAQITQKAKYGTFALTNATIETITNGVIQNGTVVISNGMITAVGTNVAVPSDAEVINCSGKTIYPGMINGGGNLGLEEVSAVDRTVDHSEIGDIIPHMQALTAVNPNSVSIPVTRVSGVTTALTFPNRGMFPGTAALIDLHGYNPDQMYAGFKGVVLDFPSTGRRGWWDRRTDEEINKAAEKAMKKLDDIYNKALQYHKIDSATGGKDQPYYPEMEALMPVVRGEMKLLVNVDASKDILEFIKWAEGKNIDPIICGAREGWRVADEIAKAGIPVIVGPVLSTPTRGYDRYDKPYANPGIMQKAGVKVAIRETSTENGRNLPYNAGFAATYGMGREEALKAITIVPAEIFGLGDKIGSLEKGKVANLFVADGDIFETKTQVSHVFISGWQIPMESRHTQLYEEFLERSPGVDK